MVIEFENKLRFKDDSGKNELLLIITDKTTEIKIMSGQNLEVCKQLLDEAKQYLNYEYEKDNFITENIETYERQQ